MLKRQTGALTLGSMVILFSIVGFFAYAAMRLVPAYHEYMNVVTAMNTIKRELEADGAAPTPKKIRTALDRHWSVNDIKSVDYRDMEIKRSKKGVLKVTADYQRETPFIGHLYLVTKFEKVIEIEPKESEY